MNKIEQIKTDALISLEHIDTQEALINWKNQILGKTGSLTEILKGLKNATPEEKATLGKEANQLRGEIESLWNEKEKNLKEAIVARALDNEYSDLTIDKEGRLGGLHPLTLVIDDVMDTFTRMGYEIWQAKEVVTEYENFDSVNVPASHPARDMQDTYWIEGGKYVLSTQTSSQQNNVLKSRKPPFQVIIPDRVFRNEDIDATHDNTFYQVEGIVVGEDISLAHLKYAIEVMLQDLFKKEVSIRMRPGFFPFVEPGVEVDFSCPFCNGSGCKVCKGSGWIEFMGAGLIHPRVLEEGGVDTNKYSGFAFGFGLNRLAMIRYGIDDMRIFMHSDVRALKQFAGK